MSEEFDPNDLALLEKLDFTFKPNCDTPKCGSEASWSMQTKCCGFQAFVCDEEKQKQDETFEALARSVFQCILCRKAFRGDPRINVMQL